MPLPDTSARSPLSQVRRITGPIPGPRSQELLAREEAAVAGSVGHVMPVFAAEAGGGVLVDVDGNSFIDLGSGIAVTGVGNADARVGQAVANQIQRLTHTAYGVVPYEGYLEVAERLNALTPGSFDKRTALFNSGAEAVENAIKIARRATGRQAIVAFDHGFHGRTNLTMALTAKSAPYKAGFGPFSAEVYRAPASYPHRDGLSGEQAAARTIAHIEAQVGAEYVAALIIEPIAGEGGFIVPAPGFLAALSAWATRNGVVFIADEIQTGFGRTGAWFASEYDDVEPDLITMAKGLAGGMPLSAVTGRADLMNAAQKFGLGGTYAGNPVACAAALATIDIYEGDGLLARARDIGELMLGRLRAMAAHDARIGDVRGRGAMIAMEFIDPDSGAPDAALTQRVAQYAHRNGVILLTCGTYGNVVRFLPPFVISDELLEEGLDVVAAGLAQS